MNKEQALQIIDEAAAMANLPRIRHIQVQEAITVIAKAIRPQIAPETDSV